MTSFEQESQALLSQIREAKELVLGELTTWFEQQPDAIFLHTHTPIDLYGYIYEGHPKRYLSGIALAGIDHKILDDWIAARPANSRIRKLFEQWRSGYQAEAWPDLEDAMLFTEDGLWYQGETIRYDFLRIADLMAVHYLLTELNQPGKVKPAPVEAAKPDHDSQLSLA